MTTDSPRISLRDIQWTPGGKNRRHASRWTSRILSLITWSAVAIAGAALYTNVLTDDTAVRERSDALARQHAGCGDRCAITHVEGRRSVIDYRADYSIEGAGSVRVTCQRKAIVFGDHECTAK